MLYCKITNLVKKQANSLCFSLFKSDIANQIGIEQNILDFGQVYINDDLTTNSKTLKLTIKNYSRTDPCDVRTLVFLFCIYISMRFMSLDRLI